MNPDIITGKQKDKFQKLSKQMTKNYISTIPIIVAPSRKYANPIIYKEHTSGNTVMSWSRIMQAEFYVKQIRNGSSIGDIVDEYHRKKSEIESFLRLYYMYNIAKQFKYESKDIQKKVEDKQNFPATTLERAFNSTTMRNFLGVSFDNKINIVGNKNKEEFKKAYKKIVTDIINKKMNSRIINSKRNIKEYIEKNEQVRPKSDGKFHYEDFVKEPIEEKVTIVKKNIKRTSPKTKGIIPPGLPFKLETAGHLKKFYDELRTLTVRKYSNSVAVMLRVFLDKTLRMYLKKIGIKKIDIKEKREIKSKKLDEVQLGDIIDYLIKRKVSIIDDNDVKRALKKFKYPTKATSSKSLAGLNNNIHSPYCSLREDEVRDIWPNLEGLFRIILQEPKRKNE